ncbi:AMP nucleosidase [Caulobacter ginsengisoli]|uniref:AMP nucleosidase n=1 Tax=Caulobacter ginsengisoli TaxID=400775 RepID=A0ABU0ISP5_9CAUL|nr:AMP nucleosidase [Caulobacter ginsengisoli]MDQ0465025.1 AMP nucleosidase [Caulobacter ginsengisoli]
MQNESEKQAVAIVERLEAEYQTSVAALRSDLKAFLKTGKAPDPAVRDAGAYTYPELRLTWTGESGYPRISRAYARLAEPGVYTTTVTRPSVFHNYLVEQLSLLIADFKVTVEVGRSEQEIPFPYVLDGGDLDLADAAASDIARHFPTTELAFIGDEVADGEWDAGLGFDRPLALFDGLRSDFSLARLKHYTGAPAEHVQQYILFTNYHRYVDEFVRWACERLKDEKTSYTALSCSGAVLVTKDTPDPEAAVANGPWRRHQMPAYHLMAENGQGITLVNIGVGPSNAKTITDHLAVLRPQAWLMIGHCGGLRGSQTIGDYVLAHAYLRDDHVLDQILPTDIPIPSIAEVQRALYDAAKQVSGESGEMLKRRLRTGTVVTTDDRNWELRYTSSALRFNQSRAVGIDMESATIAAQGYRFRVPYGTLLCVSDKPLHGEIKLPGQANAFYERAIGQHLQIGIATVDLLRLEGPGLHSRKLRAFDEPPFR